MRPLKRFGGLMGVLDTDPGRDLPPLRHGAIVTARPTTRVNAMRIAQPRVRFTGGVRRRRRWVNGEGGRF